MKYAGRPFRKHKDLYLHDVDRENIKYLQHARHIEVKNMKIAFSQLDVILVTKTVKAFGELDHYKVKNCYFSSTYVRLKDVGISLDRCMLLENGTRCSTTSLLFVQVGQIYDLCNIEPGDMGGGNLILRKMRKNIRI